MKNFIITFFCLLPILGFTSENLDDKYFNGANPIFTQQERTAIAISKHWQNANHIQPIPGADGSIRFLFGATQPSIVCAVLHVCDIALQVGEQVNSIHLGDTARWSVEPAISGVGTTEVQHLIIKPMDMGLETTLVVATNRRTYYLRLRSHRHDYMSQVAFTYPEEALAKWDAIKKQEAKVHEDNTLPKTGEYLGNLNFDYRISGYAPWKPLRVYNDGIKTIIQMPSTMAQTDAPTLLVMDAHDDTVMVNYRLQEDRYIVDTIFNKAILIAGVGSHQDRVTITKGK